MFEDDKNEDKYDMSAISKKRKSCTNDCEHIEPRPSKSGSYDHESSKEDSTIEDGFYEVISVKERRYSSKDKRYEYLVEWKGEYDDTWEPRSCLCDSSRE